MKIENLNVLLSLPETLKTCLDVIKAINRQIYSHGAGVNNAMFHISILTDNIEEALKTCEKVQSCELDKVWVKISDAQDRETISKILEKFRDDLVANYINSWREKNK